MLRGIRSGDDIPTMQTRNLWHSLPTGPHVPEAVYCIVEIPKGSRNKYEYSKVAGVIKLDRVIYSSMHYLSLIHI